MARSISGRSISVAGMALLIATSLTAPAGADERDRRDHDRWEHEEHEREWREHEWREHHYAPPPVVYVAPRQVYAPPPLVFGVPNGINIVVPLNLR